MDESTLWTWGVPVGMATLGLAGGGLMLATEAFTMPAMVAALFVDLFVASALAVQVHRRGLGRPTLVGGLAGGIGILAFFLVPLWPPFAAGADVAGEVTLLVFAPLVAGALSAGGSLFLARGVDRYRAEHGLVHAPK